MKFLVAHLTQRYSIINKNMAFNEKEQAVIKWGLENGKTKQEVTDAITKLRTGSTGIRPERTQPIVEEKPSQMSRLGTDLMNRVQNVKDTSAAVLSNPTEPFAKEKIGLRVAGQAAGAVGDLFGAGINAATGGGLDKLGEYIATTETGKQLGAQLLKLQQEQPELAGQLGDLFNIATAGVGGTAAKPVVKAIGTGVKNSAEAAINVASDITKYVPDNLSQKAFDLISSDPSAKVETILKRSTPEEVDNFLKIAAQSSVSGEAKSVFETVGDKLFDTTKVLQTKLSEIGKAKSDIMQPLRAGFDSFKKETTPFIQKLTSLKNSFTEIDAASKSKVQAIINDAKNVVTKQDADVLIDKVQDALYKGGIDMTIPKGSALDKQLRGILGEYNTALKNSLPKEYGQLNARYAQLIDSLDTINRSLGEVVEGVPVRGASLIKQYFSPSGSKAKEIFEFIKNETNGQVDLAKDATLAKFAGELYDDANVSSLLGGLKSVPTTVGGIATKLVEKLGSGRVTEAMRASTVRKAKAGTAPKVEAPSVINAVPKKKGFIAESIEMLKDPSKRQRGSITNPFGKRELPVLKSSSVNNTTDLLSEAKKYKSAEEFANKVPSNVLDKLREQGIRGGEQRMKFWEDATGVKNGDSYKMSHRPTEGVRAFNLTEKVDGEQMIPKDMYTQWYGSRGTPSDLESIAALKKIKGKPEADVTIYRASPKESFNEGDWVTFSKKYAEEHASGNNTKVFSKVVKAKDLRWAMDDVNEFGYYPKSQLEDIWKQAQKVPKTHSNFTPELKKNIADIIDTQRGIKKVSPEKMIELEADMSSIIEDFGFAVPKTKAARLKLLDSIYKGTI